MNPSTLISILEPYVSEMELQPNVLIYQALCSIAYHPIRYTVEPRTGNTSKGKRNGRFWQKKKRSSSTIYILEMKKN